MVRLFSVNLYPVVSICRKPAANRILPKVPANSSDQEPDRLPENKHANMRNDRLVAVALCCRVRGLNLKSLGLFGRRISGGSVIQYVKRI